jgi:hypothetical protein
VDHLDAALQVLGGPLGREGQLEVVGHGEDLAQRLEQRIALQLLALALAPLAEVVEVGQGAHQAVPQVGGLLLQAARFANSGTGGSGRSGAHLDFLHRRHRVAHGGLQIRALLVQVEGHLGGLAHVSRVFCHRHAPSRRRAI